MPAASSPGFHRECWLLLWRPCSVTEPLTRNRLQLNRPALSPALRSEVILARGMSQQCCPCLWIVNLTATGQQGAAQDLPLRKHWPLSTKTGISGQGLLPVLAPLCCGTRTSCHVSREALDSREAGSGRHFLVDGLKGSL